MGHISPALIWEGDIPLPPGQASGIDAVESKRQHTTDHGTKVAQDGYPHNTRCQFIRSVPVAQLQENSRPETRLKQTEQGPDGIEAACVGDGGVAAENYAP